MATAKIETVSKTVEKEVEEKVYNLALSKEEAETLYSLLSNVEGNRFDTYNMHTSAVWNALLNTGAIGYATFGSRFTISYGVIGAKRMPATSSF